MRKITLGWARPDKPAEEKVNCVGVDVDRATKPAVMTSLSRSFKLRVSGSG